MTIKRFLIHLLIMSGVILFIVLALLFWLRVYTNHGQKLELPNYKEMRIDDAISDAKSNSFEIIVKDSLFRVDLPGGLILNQNPLPGSMVKENRKVYVDISRFNATVNKLSDLPMMYGREYESVKRSLSHLEITSSIKDYRYDKGEPDHILEVWYDGRLVDGKRGKKEDVEIKTGGELQFVLSKSEGGMFEMPDLVCDMVNIAKFKIQSSKLKIGNIQRIGLITTTLDSTFVIAQDPPYVEGSKIQMGQTINITVSQQRPENCQ